MKHETAVQAVDEAALVDAWDVELSHRRAALWEIVEAHECDAALVFGGPQHDAPFRYLTNFVPALGDMWAVATGPSALRCVVQFTWQLTEASRASGIDDWEGAFDSVPVVADSLQMGSPRRVAVVGKARIPAGDLARLAESVGTDFVDVDPDFMALRRNKSPFEVELLRRAGRIVDHALEATASYLVPGVSEREVAARLEFEVATTGGEPDVACVISGIDDPIPIRMPTGRVLEAGDTVMIDLVAGFSGYQADISRTFVLGTPTPKQQLVWDTVTEAYAAAVRQLQPGTRCRHSHAAAVEVIERAGYDLVHRIGHGIGLATSFEWPSLDTEEAPLMAGMTICIEPGIYTPGAGNMKLEDDFVITATGAEALTHATREIALG